eukprot:gnl/Dysnectes_brevis/752_a826_4733.p1 GENE.gnl/Dysnectes_brevis/752_a826_4733~~gnl/Dysnectes_brevis/752_a826_4733.p1  ORF type:complete len:193 (-),score=52.52 gnl/Dysnectes_brevis/752_a826_4733:50-628(-)
MYHQPRQPVQPQGAHWLSSRFSAIPPHVMAQLQQKFHSIDSDHSGFISVAELQNAFSTPSFAFPTNTAKSLVRMFSSHGQISFQQFAQLDQFVSSISNTFQQHDRDRSGSIGVREMPMAMHQLGFQLNQTTLNALMQTYDPHQTGFIEYSGFLAACVLCGLARTLFSNWDVSSTGSITVGLEQVVAMALWFV